MGDWGSRHSNGWHLEQLGLLQASNVQTVSATGTYSISSALDSTTDPTTLRIPRDLRRRRGGPELVRPRDPQAGGVFESFPGALGSRSAASASARSTTRPS